MTAVIRTPSVRSAVSAEPELQVWLVEELQRAGTHADDPLERFQVGVECLLDLLERNRSFLPTDPQLHGQLAHATNEGDEHPGEVVRNARREAALGDALPDDALQP